MALQNPKRRTKQGQVDQGQIESIEHNSRAGARKVMQAGPQLEILGTLAAEKSIGYGRTVWVYNNAVAVGFVAFYEPGEAAPTPQALATGIPVPPNSYIQLSSGNKSIIVGSAATLGVYLVVDDSYITEGN